MLVECSGKVGMNSTACHHSFGAPSDEGKRWQCSFAVFGNSSASLRTMVRQVFPGLFPGLLSLYSIDPRRQHVLPAHIEASITA